MKLVYVLAVTLIVVKGIPRCYAGGAQLTLSGDFEGRNRIEQFIYRDHDGGLSIDYYSPSLSKPLSFAVSKFDECSTMAIYAIPNTRQIAIDGSCTSQGGQIYKYVYQWDDKYSNWCLIREISGEKPDVTTGRVSSSEHVARVSGCAKIGDPGPYEYEAVASEESSR
jgi:hypothetical protein